MDEDRLRIRYVDRFRRLDFDMIGFTNMNSVLESQIKGYEGSETRYVPDTERVSEGKWNEADITVKLRNETHTQGGLQVYATWTEVEVIYNGPKKTRGAVFGFADAVQRAYDLKPYDRNDESAFPELTQKLIERHANT